MIRLLHLSDTHFGTEVDTVVEALLARVSQLQPTLVVCSGDVTQRALASEFERAAAFFRRFGDASRVLIPGNHDIPLWNLWNRFTRPYVEFERTLGPLESTVETPLLRLFALNTTHPMRHKHGYVSPAQVERVSRHLRQSAALQLRIVVTHQPLYVEAASDKQNQLRGGALAAESWAASGVDLVLGGHIHLPYFKSVPHSFATISRTFWVAQAGTAVSDRTRSNARNSFNMIHWDGTRCDLERWDYDPVTLAFERHSAVSMPITR